MCAANAEGPSARPLMTRTGRGAGGIRGTGRAFAGLLRVDVRLANEAAVFVRLLAKKSAEIRAAHRDWIEPLGDELRLDLGYLQGCGEPAGELGDHFLRRLRRRDHTEP